MVIDQPPVDWSLPAHRHANEDETIHIIEGDFEMELGGELTRLSAGETIHIPKNPFQKEVPGGRRRIHNA